jgi:hypothetical protein
MFVKGFIVVKEPAEPAEANAPERKDRGIAFLSNKMADN